jgi:hypothetical protein
LPIALNDFLPLATAVEQRNSAITDELMLPPELNYRGMTCSSPLVLYFAVIIGSVFQRFYDLSR